VGEISERDRKTEYQQTGDQKHHAQPRSYARKEDFAEPGSEKTSEDKTMVVGGALQLKAKPGCETLMWPRNQHGPH